MGATFDVTVIGAELLDNVVFMENSPAYLAFSEEIIKILSDFNKTNLFSFEIDTAELVEHSKDTLHNMQKAFLQWTFYESDTDKNYRSYLKLFCKSQEKYIVAANEGLKKISIDDIPAVKKKYLDNLVKNPEAFTSVKDFFAGYIYGYFFNYISEQVVMREYAELLVCLGIMSQKIRSTGNAAMKILPRMGKLLDNDRFKYISGELPLAVIMDIIVDRFNLENLTEAETAKVRAEIQNIITTEFDYNINDDLIKDSVLCDVFDKLGKQFVSAPDFAGGIFRTCFEGVRTFTDGDREDFGIYTPEYITGLINLKCENNFDSFYTDDAAFMPDYTLSGNFKGFKYPLIVKSSGIFQFSEIYLYALFPALHSQIYMTVEASDMPFSMFPFIENVLRTDAVRGIGGLTDQNYMIRLDKQPLFDKIVEIMADTKLQDKERKMTVLELTLAVISGNMDAAGFNNFVSENVFNTKLFENYIRYRIEAIIQTGLTNRDTKKALLDKVNALN
jgi:hypothetical protein